MFRKLFLAVAVMAVIVLFGCNNSGSLRTITITVTETGGEADAVCLYLIKDIWGNLTGHHLAKAEVKNSKFTLKLPETVDSEYLRPVNKVIAAGEDITISDPSAKCSGATIKVFKHGKVTGSFIYEFRNDTMLAQKYIVYADKDVNIAGSMDFGKKFSCSLKKGWNYVAVIRYNGNEEVTTTLPTELKQ